MAALQASRNTHAQRQTHAHARTHAYTHARTHAHTHTHARTHAHARAHTHNKHSRTTRHGMTRQDEAVTETGLVNVGDEILKIDGTRPLSSQHVMSLARGLVGTEVAFCVLNDKAGHESTVIVKVPLGLLSSRLPLVPSCCGLNPRRCFVSICLAVFASIDPLRLTRSLNRAFTMSCICPAALPCLAAPPRTPAQAFCRHARSRRQESRFW